MLLGNTFWVLPSGGWTAKKRAWHGARLFSFSTYSQDIKVWRVNGSTLLGGLAGKVVWNEGLVLLARVGRLTGSTGYESGGEEVEGESEAGPPDGDSGVVDEAVVEDVEDFVGGEGGDDQPEARADGESEEGGGDQDSATSARVELPMTAKRM